MTDPENSPAPGGEITELLRRWSEGKSESLEPLFTIVYPRLRQIANALFRGESPGSLLQPTSVVNELFIKLVHQHSLQFENRQHFFSLSASLMRRILIDHARSQQRVKRDGGVKVPLRDELAYVSTIPSADLLDIDRALLELQKIDPRKAQMIELRLFLGSTADETAALLKISKATVDRELKFARGWLYERLQSGTAVGNEPA
jgi:RNA polymerase sigma factor (TIGR02999 family)